MSDQVVTVLTLILMGLCGVGSVGMVIFMFAAEGLFPFGGWGKYDTSQDVHDGPIYSIIPSSKLRVTSESDDTTTAKDDAHASTESDNEAEAQSPQPERTDSTHASASESAEQSTQPSTPQGQGHHTTVQQ